ncbi:CCCH-type zinc finger-containing protein [Planoprotostelium fungivorum]|uniref:CCCH-type zinc finger-containing protein n=1 Tax=Planoprotostelium fungivorum TaxID=1890364 RepID=A0A2P6N8Q1_9EUKA|nr:CCCH-type zinc finger-containing protein [Planoprotostelium fungivorum]
MPPKSGPSKKTVDKAKNKIVEDKTFGLKNKNKSKTVQKYVQNVTNNVKGGSANQEAANRKKAEEKAKLEREALERDLFKPVITQKAPVGVDPKSIVCEFFKKGICGKGAKCKFSHNLAQERMSEKVDLYTDKRAIGEEDTIDNWDQTQLESVVNSKQTTTNKNLPTKIVCKYFLEAIENKQYGWFWECPNGGEKCMYVHALPPGYEFKTKKKDDEEEVEETPIEEIIEEEKLKLTTRTPLTRETFEKWKADKKKAKEEKELAEKSQRDADIKSGKTMRSGRDLFLYNPDLFVDDENVFETEGLEPEEDDEPAIHLSATGTSITSTKTGGEGSFIAYDADGNLITNVSNKEEKETVEKVAKLDVNEELFNEDDIPDDV